MKTIPTLENDLTLMGDCHLGKEFVSGVPLHRRGEREEMVWNDFEASLMNCTTPLHVQVGDIFDKFSVPESVVLRAADIYRRAASKNRSTIYVIYRGNHDGSRDADKASSFDVLQALLSQFDNVMVLTEVQSLFYEGRLWGFIPWHPFTSASELAMKLKEKLNAYGHQQYDAVFGHWDSAAWNGNDHNLMPLEQLQSMTKVVVSGHEHTAGESEKMGMKVYYTGSMQPYSHAEDPEGVLYVTHTREQVEANLLSDQGPEGTVKQIGFYHNKNLRVLVADGEVVPEIDCLSLVTKRVEATVQTEEDDYEVTLEDFSMDRLMAEAMAEAGVDADVASEITTKFSEMRQ